MNPTNPGDRVLTPEGSGTVRGISRLGSFLVRLDDSGLDRMYSRVALSTLDDGLQDLDLPQPPRKEGAS